MNTANLARAAALLSTALIAGNGYGATQVYRCGNTYTDQPCPAARPVDVTDTRSNEQVRIARAQAASEQKALRQQQADQRAQAKAAAPVQARPVALSSGPNLIAHARAPAASRAKTAAKSASAPVLYAVPKAKASAVASR